MAEGFEKDGEYDLLVAACGHSIEEDIETDNPIYVCTYAKKNDRPQKNPPNQTKYFAPYKDKKIKAVYEIDCLVNVKRDGKEFRDPTFERSTEKISYEDAKARVKEFLQKSPRVKDFDNEDYLLDQYGMNLLLLSSKAETDCDSEVVQHPTYGKDIARDLQPNTSRELAEKMRGKVFRE